MKTFKIIAAVIAFLVLPTSQDLRAQEAANQAPPIEQTLVREGDFAVKLVERLRIGIPQNEAEAETMLSSTGISPRNGWISDYPVTPDIIGELQNAVGDAADAGRLSMGRDEALKRLEDLVAEVGLSVVADRRADYPSEEPLRTYSYYSEPAVTNYYNTYGPPIVTYYPPPWPYLYLYAWVPYPFCWTGWYFAGFYVLHHFHRCVHVHHPHHHHGHHVYISNHWRDPKTRRVFVIDPFRRHIGDFSRHRVTGAQRGFTSPEARKGASAILEQSRGRLTPGAPGVKRPGGPPVSKGPSSPRPGGMIERQSSNHGPGSPSSYGGKPSQMRGPMGNQKTDRPPAEAGFREREIGAHGRLDGADRPGGTIQSRIPGGHFIPHNSPGGSVSRSFSPPSHSGVKSFSPPSLGNQGSFGTPHGGTGGFGFDRGGL